MICDLSARRAGWDDNRAANGRQLRPGEVLISALSGEMSRAESAGAIVATGIKKDKALHGLTGL